MKWRPLISYLIDRAFGEPRYDIKLLKGEHYITICIEYDGEPVAELVFFRVTGDLVFLKRDFDEIDEEIWKTITVKRRLVSEAVKERRGVEEE